MTMRTLHRSIILIAPALVVALGGCFKLSRESPRLEQYVLSGVTRPSAVAGTVSGAVAATPGTAAGLTLGVRRMDIASYLAVPAIIVRRGVNEIYASEFHRWGEDLGEGINRVVAANLANSPPVLAVDVAPWAARAQHNFLVQLHVSRFEGVADSGATQGRIHVMAGWDIIRPSTGAVLVRGTTDDRGGSWRVGDYGSLVTELDAALARMATSISACLARFPNDSTPPASCGEVPAASGSAR
jgi:uncharacterized lipoprotein YmbA